MLKLKPMTLKDARIYVERNHRHNRAPQGGLFAVGAECHSSLVGVVIVGRPVARGLDDGQTVEVTRLATCGARNACSILYGAACRAAAALGYQRIITYTLASEPGVSLRASGWEREAEVEARATWSTPSRLRVQSDLFGNEARPTGPKVRWCRKLRP